MVSQMIAETATRSHQFLLPSHDEQVLQQYYSFIEALLLPNIAANPTSTE